MAVRTTATAHVAVTQAGLQPVDERGWRAGFANLLRRENGVWWGSRKWLVQLVVWLIVLSGFGLLGAISQEPGQVMTVADRAQKAVSVFFGFAAFCAVAGVVISTQGAIVEEKQLGTAAWILSKPVSRSAMILSKLIAYAAAFAILMVTLPGVAFYGASHLLWGHYAPAAAAFSAALAALALYLAFYLTLMLLLGTLFNTRGPVAGIAASGLVVGQVVGGLLPNVAIATPWALPQIALDLATGQRLPAGWPLSIGVMVILCLACIAGAIRRFSRDEF